MARRNLKNWLEKNNLPYRIPHGFRRGHIHWGRDHSKDVTDFKAVSENVMHADTLMTDRIYSSVKGSELNQRIQSLGENTGGKISVEEAISEITKILRNLEDQI